MSSRVGLINDNIMLLSKRRSQLKQTVAKIVQQCCTNVEEITDLPVKLRLIDTLRMVTEGKVSFCWRDFLLQSVRAECFCAA